jgi:hypothetical protein
VAIAFVDTATYAVEADPLAAAKADLTGLANGHWVGIALTCDFDDDWSSIETNWTKVDQLHTTGGRRMTTCYCYKFMTDVAGEPATWSFGTGAGRQKAGVMFAFSGVDSGGYLDASGTTADGTADTSPDAPDITTATDGAEIIILSHFNHGTGGANFVAGEPSAGSWATAISAWRDTGDTTVTQISYKNRASAGTETIGDWTSSSDFELNYHVRTIALKPAGAVTATALPMMMNEGLYVGV